MNQPDRRPTGHSSPDTAETMLRELLDATKHQPIDMFLRQRCEAALVPSAPAQRAPDVVPDGWQWRAREAEGWSAWMTITLGIEYFGDRFAREVASGHYEVRPLYALTSTEWPEPIPFPSVEAAKAYVEDSFTRPDGGEA